VVRDGDETATLSLGAKLVRFKSNEVVAARLFEASAPVAGGGIAAVVAAFQKASNELMPAVVEWTLATGEASAEQSLPPGG
jgi:ABC-type uncharacterized transport system auxiliary subunit